MFVKASGAYHEEPARAASYFTTQRWVGTGYPPKDSVYYVYQPVISDNLLFVMYLFALNILCRIILSPMKFNLCLHV